MKILYEDKHCRITDVCIIIYRYYFPLATSKTILYSDIQKIDLVDAHEVNVPWGVCTAFLNNWFHMDGQRNNKDKFLSISLKNNKIRPSLTPTDSRMVFNILRSHFTQIQRKSVAFRSDVDKVTEQEQKQVHEEFMNDMKKVQKHQQTMAPMAIKQ